MRPLDYVPVPRNKGTWTHLNQIHTFIKNSVRTGRIIRNIDDKMTKITIVRIITINDNDDFDE